MCFNRGSCTVKSEKCGPCLCSKNCFFISSQPQQGSEPLAITASATEVTDWLKANRFQNFVKIFQNFSGIVLNISFFISTLVTQM